MYTRWEFDVIYATIRWNLSRNRTQLVRKTGAKTCQTGAKTVKRAQTQISAHGGFSLHLDFRTFSDHLELNPLRFGSKSKLVGMASTEPDRLRSCTTLTTGIRMIDGQLGGLDTSKLDEQIRVARMQFYHDSTNQIVVSFPTILKDFSPVVSCCRAWGCHGKVAVHANGDGPYVRYGPSGFSWRTVINSTDMHHGFYYTFNWRS